MKRYDYVEFIQKRSSCVEDDDIKNYSQQEILNINKVFKNLSTRLDSSSSNLYSSVALVKFLETSLSYINLTLCKTKFAFDDTKFVDVFHHLIVEGADILSASNEISIKDGKELFDAWIKDVKVAKNNFKQKKTT